MQAIANKHLDAFNDMAKITKSYILALNNPTQIQVSKEYEKMNNNVSRLKYSRLIRSKNVDLRKRKGRNQ